MFILGKGGGGSSRFRNESRIKITKKLVGIETNLATRF